MPPVRLRIKRRLEEMEKRRPSTDVPDVPREMLVEVSNLCNQKCVFCAYPKMTRPGKRIEVSLIERVLREGYDLGTREVGFYSGAEPFTTPHLEQIVAIAKAIGYEYTFITTNGSLATEARVKALIDNGLDSLKFSINAGDRESYREIHGQDHFERVLKNLRFASEYRERVDSPMYLAVSFVGIDHEGYNNLHTRAALEALVAPWVDEVVFYDAGADNGQMLGLPPHGAAAPCQLPFFRVHVSAEGYLRACCNDYQNYLSLADLNHTSLREAWLSPEARDLRRRHLENRLEGTLCFNCIHNTLTPIEPLQPSLAVKVEPEFFLFKKYTKS